MNFTKGVIKTSDLKDMSQQEIIANMHSQDVIDCKRISFVRDFKTIDTNTYILTFNHLQLPSTFHLGYLRVREEQYIPRPLICTKCQKFGHHHSRCGGTVSVCYRCSVSHSQETSCALDAPLKCVSCFGDHPSSSKQCPKYQQEQEIIKLKYTLYIPFPEARKRILSKPSLSYASLATVKTSSIGLQTESLSTEYTLQAKPPTLSVNTLPKASTNIPTPPSPKPGPSNKRTSSQQSARSTKTVPSSSKPHKAQRNLNLKAAAAQYNKFSVLD